MQYTQSHSLADLLSSSSALGDFTSKLQQLSQINHLVTSKLEPEFKHNCRVANLRDGTLILSTTSPTWNHKLRFQSLDLLSSLRAIPQWAGLKAIEIRVDYLPQTTNNTTTSSKKPKPISKKSAEALAAAARAIRDEKLAASLTKLSNLKIT